MVFTVKLVGVGRNIGNAGRKTHQTNKNYNGLSP